MRSNIQFIGALVIGFFAGLGVFYKGFVAQKTLRDPAALNGKVFQISDLTHDEIKLQLQKKLKVSPTIDGLKSISFSGFSSAICKTYADIEVELTAEGISVAGEPPALKVSAPCIAGQDPSEIASLKIPIDQLLKEKPRNAEFKFDGYNSTMTLLNSADEWPRQWVLKRVEFKNSGGQNKQVEFNRSPASAPEEMPIVLEF